MEKLLSSWALATFLRRQAERWLARIGKTVPRDVVKRIRAMLYTLEAEIREALGADAIALKIAPYTPKVRHKTEARKARQTRPRCFPITLTHSRAGIAPPSAHKQPLPDAPSAPLHERFACAAAILDDPAPYARRLALSRARTLAGRVARAPGLDPGSQKTPSESQSDKPPTPAGDTGSQIVPTRKPP